MATNNDYGHRQTDKQLAELEKRIARLYKQAASELQDTIDDYFAKFAKRDEEMKAMLDAGEITEEHYKQWRLNQMGRGERFEAMRDKLAQRYTDANAVAVAYTNDATPGIYSLNRNYSAYTIEQVAGNADFTLFDEQTVKRLIVEEPDLMPYYPKARALKRGIDLEYGKKQITNVVTSSILQGKSIKGIADDLQTRIPDMNRASAIRTARTAITGAQNAGRMDSYKAAQAKGIKLKREWLATLDKRTRHEHAMLDGQKADMDKPFKVDGYEIMYPGDMSAPAHLVYNCRCTLIAAVDGVDTSDAQRRARDPETGENVLIKDMTYQEWAGWKKAENPQAWKVFEKKGQNMSTDKKQFAQYREVLKSKSPETLAEFQNLKYNEPEKWEQLKDRYRYKRRIPEATENDYQTYKKIKATGILGSVRVPPHPIDIETLEFKDEHAGNHGVTLDDAKLYIKNAKFSLSRKRWDGVSFNYYSEDGATYVDDSKKLIKTAFPRENFDSVVNKAMEVINGNSLLSST